MAGRLGFTAWPCDRRNPNGQHVGRNIAEDHGIRADDGPSPQANRTDDLRPGGHDYLVFNDGTLIHIEVEIGQIGTEGHALVNGYQNR